MVVQRQSALCDNFFLSSSGGADEEAAAATEPVRGPVWGSVSAHTGLCVFACVCVCFVCVHDTRVCCLFGDLSTATHDVPFFFSILLGNVHGLEISRRIAFFIPSRQVSKFVPHVVFYSGTIPSHDVTFFRLGSPTEHFGRYSQSFGPTAIPLSLVAWWVSTP